MCDRSSKPADAVVIVASERSGSISEMALTKVDLPTPNPPATTILTGIFPPLAGMRGSEVADTVEDPFEEACERLLLLRGVQHHCTVGDEIGDEHAGHADRDLESGGDLDQRHRRLDELDDLGGLPPVGTEVLRRTGGGLDLSFETDLGFRCGAATDHGVGPDQTSGLGAGVVTVVGV